MHELPITQGILSIVLQHAKSVQARRITSINVKVGEISGVVPDYVRLQFDLLSKDTIAEGANLIFLPSPTSLRCRRCGRIYTPENPDWICPECGNNKFEIMSGRECSVESMEIG